MSVAPKPGLVARTLISQYANSPTLVQLINNMDDYINPDADFDAFYDFVWNVETAQGFGLDIWGRIVDVGRMLTIPGDVTYLGYEEALNWQPFGQAPFYTGELATQTYRLADDAYRTLILVKALANISDCTSPSLNRLLSNLFAGRGRCYVSDTGKMEFRYVFEFALAPHEIAILTQSRAIPKPAAVQARILQVDLSTTFGFNEGADAAVWIRCPFYLFGANSCRLATHLENPLSRSRIAVPKNAIPVASQIGVTPGVASFTDGFPPLTMTPLAAGGVPPHGADFNGIFNFLSAAVRWAQSGGGYAYDSAFSTAIGGYPKGAWLRQASGNGYWLSLLDNNISNPDTGGAGWVATGAGIATTGQAQAMIDDSVLLTPKKLVDAFTPGQVLSFMGLNQQLPGGLILKSGAFNGVSGTINFPTPFPNLAFAVFGAESAVLGAESLDFVMFQYRGLDRFKFNPELRNKSGTYPNAASVRYLAIGY